MKLSKRKTLFTLVLGTSCLIMSNIVGITQVQAEELILKVSSLEIKTDSGVNEAEVRRLLPELESSDVRIGKLSKNIQLVNSPWNQRMVIC